MVSGQPGSQVREVEDALSVDPPAAIQQGMTAREAQFNMVPAGMASKMSSLTGSAAGSGALGAGTSSGLSFSARALK